MANFEIHELEGMRYVDCILDNETVRAESGALSYMTGDIQMHSEVVPSPVRVLRSVLANQAVFRPTYTGTGVVTLESSLGGFHILELHNENWILERGTYWASEDSVDVSFYRVGILTSLWAGEGLVYLQTEVHGSGKVVLTTRGPIQRVTLEKGRRIVADGSYVIAWSSSVKFSVRRPTKNVLGRFTSGEGLARVHEGPGELLINPSPYWRYRMFAQRQGDPIAAE